MPGAEIEVWLVDLPECSSALGAVETETPRLSPADCAKLEAIKNEGVRAARRASHIALRVLIERTFGPSLRRVPFTLSPAGKPSLPGIAGGFSLSHVDGFALIGLSRIGSIGVDLEAHRSVRLSDARRERIEEAGRTVAPHAPLPPSLEARLLQAWVRLEALAKAEGCGLARVLQRHGIVGKAVPGSAAPALRVTDLELGSNLRGAVALANGMAPLRSRHFPKDVRGIAALAAPPCPLA